MYKVVFKNDNELIVNIFSTLIDAEKAAREGVRDGYTSFLSDNKTYRYCQVDKFNTYRNSAQYSLMCSEALAEGTFR